MRTRLLPAAALAALGLLAALRAAALDGLVIAHEGAPGTSLTSAALKSIYTGKQMHWEGGQAITIVFLGEATDAALKEASGMDSSAFKTFWQRLAFSGRGQQPKKADGAAAAVALVGSTKGAIAIVPAGTELKGVKKLDIKD